MAATDVGTEALGHAPEVKLWACEDSAWWGRLELGG